MATSSILKTINIEDPEKVKKFIEALEKAEAIKTNLNPVKYTDIKRENIKDLFN